MLRPQSSPFTVPSWLKWSLAIAGTLFILAFILFLWVYIDVNQDRKEGHTEAETIALEQGDLATVNHVSTYHGKREFHIVQGMNESKEASILFIDIKENKILDEVLGEEALSLEEMRSRWENTCSSCTFKDIQYGFEENEPVFQLTYIDDQDRYVLDYFTLQGEAFDQRFAFRQNE
ncbi:cell wall elongation regulator TseB-like domain-containing protein [Halobacillus faecis]